MSKKLKKILSIILCTTLLLGASQVCLAEEMYDEEIIQIDIAEDLLNPADFEEANNALVARGQAAIRQRSTNYLNVPHYYQNGQTWSNDIMQSRGLTIGSAGCCLTSFTMIQRYLGGNNNPRGVNNALGNAACLFNYSTAATIFGYTISNYKHETVSDEYAIDFIAGAIDLGYPVLVGMEKDSDDSTHFVAAYGHNGNTIFIHDPASGRDYATLDTYLQNYHVNRLYVYKN